MNRPELALALRRARNRLVPAEVGLPVGERRRVRGLRREEVAMLAGVSVDYVVRLEQGRGPQPSEQVLTALARALRMDTDERNEIFLLAGHAAPRPGTINELVRPSVLRLLDRLGELPAVVISAKSDLLAWNASFAALMGDWSQVPQAQRNLIWQRFLGPHAGMGGGRVALGDEERGPTDAQSVASLRSAVAKYPHDPGLARMVAELRARSAEFERLWHEGGAAPWRSHTKTIDHPSLGPLRLDCDSMHLPDADQTVIVYSAEQGSREAEALALLRVIGTEQMVAPR
ncbi:MAG TPA: helix-turn-helix transcriptional regulator [Propionibacteriaceae bacterium]|nr:helix-turn-helix transcriptional regulator [Propionibacteriaceae bacterium]